MAKTTSSRTSEPAACPPGWAWLLAGVLIGVFGSFLYYVTQIAPEDLTQASSSTVQPPQVITEQSLPSEQVTRIPSSADLTESAATEVVAASLQVPEPDFDFYEELPNSEGVNEPSAETVVTTMPVVPAAVEPTSVPQNLTPGRTYLLQVGSFREQAQAEGLKAHLALLGITSQVQQVNLAGVVWHRVQIGPFNDLTVVNQMQQRLATEQISSLVLNP